MQILQLRRAGAVFAALALAVAACGDGDQAADRGDTSTTVADLADGHDHDHDDGHHHGGLDVSGWAEVPAVTIEATPDPKAGVNVRIDTEHFSFAPERASGANVEGEGHAHLYVDGEKVGRVYGGWFHLDGLTPGDHEITVDLNANDHSTLELGGEAIAATVSVTVPATTGSHGHAAEGREAAVPAPTVAIEAFEDAKSGFNVRVETTDFTFAPEHASGEAVDGEGHAHLYVDGQKVARLYTSWFHLDGLTPGDHEITVSLNGNDHVALVRDGQAIEASTTVTVEGDDDAPAVSADQVIELVFENGEIDGGGRIPVDLGDTVLVRITSDVADEVHLHGYDLVVALTAGEPAELSFDATIPGVFELELHDARLPLAELEIS